MEYKKHDMYRQAGAGGANKKLEKMPAPVKAELDVKIKEEVIRETDIIEIKEVKKEVKKEFVAGMEIEVPELVVHKKKKGPAVVVPMPMPEADEKACGYCVTPGMAYVPATKWNTPYEPEVGFHRGTIFPELDYPFVGKGACDHE